MTKGYDRLRLQPSLGREAERAAETAGMTLDAVDLVIVGTAGIVSLRPVLAALEAGKVVAMANKETLVAGGHLVMPLAAARAAEVAARDPASAMASPLAWLRPIDSEHSAIWQCLLGERIEQVRRLVLTASGGPFRDREPQGVAGVTPAEALAHPTWQMGPKITIDSATLVNKAFEVIEARWLYRLPYSRIDAVIHPGSIIHSLVEFIDGSYKAQLGIPDMRLPIQYALTHPDRLPSPGRTADPPAWGPMELLPLDQRRYPAYQVVRAAAEAGGNRGTILNAADEVAVAAFLAGAIGFDRIPALIDDAVTRWGRDDEPALADIAELDVEVRTALQRELGVGQTA